MSHGLFRNFSTREHYLSSHENAFALDALSSSAVRAHRYTLRPLGNFIAEGAQAHSADRDHGAYSCWDSVYIVRNERERSRDDSFAECIAVARKDLSSYRDNHENWRHWKFRVYGQPSLRLYLGHRRHRSRRNKGIAPSRMRNPRSYRWTGAPTCITSGVDEGQF